MGRQIRRVVPNWQHPKKDFPNHRLQRMEEGYQPMFDQDFESAMKEWLDELNKWLNGQFALILAKHPELPYKPDEPYRAFCCWRGEAPDPEYYRPVWKEEDRTWFQVYETVSEGKPVTPPFATRQELVCYLATHGDFWDQRRGDGPWTLENAESFVKNGSAMSMIMVTSNKGVEILTPRDGEPK
jgi:hypothetical protein